jgi:hypothetical protein
MMQCARDGGDHSRASTVLYQNEIDLGRQDFSYSHAPGNQISAITRIMGTRSVPRKGIRLRRLGELPRGPE